MKLSDGIIEGLDNLQGILNRSHGLGGVQFRIIIKYEKFETCNNGLWDYDDWVVKYKVSKPYANGYYVKYQPDSPKDMNQLKFDIKKYMIEFPQQVKL